MKMENLRNKYIWIALPYFFAVGVLYLWGYWGSFEINIFEYADFSDLVKVAIIPVGSTFVFILLGFFFGAHSPKPVLPEGGGRDTIFGRFLNKTIWVWISGYWVILLFLISTDYPGKWKVIPIVGMIFPFIQLKSTEFLGGIRSDSVRSILIMSFCFLPIYSFCQGKINASEIIIGKSYKYVESIAGMKNVKFIGHVGQNIFLLSEDNSKLVIQKLTDKPIVLSRSSADESKLNKSIQATAKASAD